MFSRSSLLLHRSINANTKALHRLPSRSFARREAPLAALSNPVEHAIAAAQQRGDLDNLHGAGKPLKQGVEASRVVPTGMTSSELLSKKAEFEMRRAMHNKELEHVMTGQKMEYKGTSIGSVGIGSGNESGGKDGSEVMGQYIAKQAQPTAQDLKS